MPNPQDLLSAPQSDYEAWRDLVRSMSGRYYSEASEPDKFSGWVRPVPIRGFTALNIGSNARRVERTRRDIRLDGADHYFKILFAAGGRLAMLHNDQAVQLAVGDVALVDSSRPATYCSDGDESWNIISLSLERQSVLSYLGFEPRGGVFRRSGTPAGRLLFDLVRTTVNVEDAAFSPADSYMQLAVYDLVGALFAPSEPGPGSRHTDKLFARIRDIIKAGCADPDFGSREVAAKAGISLRYLQKLFTERGLTCSEVMYSHRLDHAAQLLQRRRSLATGQCLSEIAYACGFRDYTHFARKFRQRFGCPPGIHAERPAHCGDGKVRC
jgi:AraC family transcriptional regulator, positive regulator of tynA and feaB